MTLAMPSDQQRLKWALWATPKSTLQYMLEDLFIEASIKELIKQELARRNAFHQTSATA